MPGAELPPVFSGYTTEDRSGWDEFREEYRRTHAEMHADFDEFVRERGCPPLPALEFIHESPALNLYLYPADADYRAVSTPGRHVAAARLMRSLDGRALRRARGRPVLWST